MGTNTDPYQRCEGKYRLTRGVVEALSAHANPFSILTKSPLVLRDLDLLVDAARRTDVDVNFSIGTLDEHVWRATEPGTPHPRRRVEALRQLAAAGVRTGALIAPVLPSLSDSPRQLSEVADAVRDAGGRLLATIPLHLRPGVREHFLAWLESYDGELHAEYLRRYARSDYAPARYADRIRGVVHGGSDGTASGRDLDADAS
jgi:DNA repair photolyase